MSRSGFALAAILAAPLSAQVVDTAQGRIEFLGLGRCTPEQLDAAVTERCKAHYCAADLKNKLGFAEAAVFILGGKEGDVRKLVVVVEPAERVQKKVLPAAVPLPAAWAAVVEADPMAFDLALRGYPQLLAEGEATARAELAKLDWAADSLPRVGEVWTFLQVHAAPEHLPGALWHLDHHGDFAARQLAAAVLLNFHDRDVAWWALADGLRDPEDRVNGACQTALRGLGERCRRQVDWTPATPALAAVLAGTQCFAVPDLCRVLVATEVQPGLAPALLGPGRGELVLAYAGSQAEFARERARELLCHLAGGPATASIEELRAFVARAVLPAEGR
jgi:hypothetical protein